MAFDNALGTGQAHAFSVDRKRRNHVAKLTALLLLVVLFPGLVLGIVLGLLVHPLFFFLLVLLFFALPPIMTLSRRQDQEQGG
jgi:Flp pilus assembly protein TadB